MDTTTISVCMITYNHGDYIKSAIEGVLNQKCNFNIELVISDDCSTDLTRDFCIKYKEKYPTQIRLLLPESNLGMQGNFHKALSACTGKYIAICEGDDYWTDTLKLQKQIDFLELNTDYSFCWCRFKTFDQKTGEFRDDLNGHYFNSDSTSTEFDFNKFYIGWQLGIQTMVFRTSLLTEFEIEVKKYTYWKDIHLITYLLKKGKSCCLNFFGAVYRIHDGGVYSGESRLNNAKISFHSYHEIYLQNQDIDLLKLKYLKFAEYYIDLLLEMHHYPKAISIANKVDKKQLINTIVKISKALPKNLKMIIKNILKSLIKNENQRNSLRNSLSKIKELKKKYKPIECPEYFKWVNSIGITETPRAEKLIVSLTSFPPRIKQVKYAINSLLNQTIKPDIVVLWLAEGEFPNKEKDLPRSLLKLKKYGLTIEWYAHNIKPYKKLIPSLLKYPNDIIITVDDDVFYRPDWLEKLYSCHLENPKFICCHRAHEIKFENPNNLTSYNNWNFATSDHTASYTKFMTGVGGVLYPPKSLHDLVTNMELFQKLIPSNDDIWFWGMAILNNTKIKVVEDNQAECLTIDKTQDNSLFHINVINGNNDKQITNLINQFPQIISILTSKENNEA